MKASTQLEILGFVRMLAAVALPVSLSIGLRTHLHLSESIPFPIVLAGLPASWWICRRLANAWATRLMRRKAAELAAVWSEPARRRQLLDEIADGYRTMQRFPDLWLRLQWGAAMVEEERWRELRRELRLIDPGEFGTLNDWLVVEGWMVWALAHDGLTREAVVRGQRALERAEAADVSRLAPPFFHWLRAALGVALVLDRRPAAAVRLLRPAIEAGAVASDLAAWRYYLGLALSAQGRLDEARAAWEQTRGQSPTSRWAARAAEQLAVAPGIYR